MINYKDNFIILVLVSSILICACHVVLPGVSHICHNPEGRLGRCTSIAACHNHPNCNRTASVYGCPNGHGEPPYVCCIFGKNIVFPDDGPATNKTDDDAIIFRSTAAESNGKSILFPDENGDFSILKDRVGEKKILQKSGTADLFPRPPNCGPMVVGDKIHGGDEAALGEFAWLVNLEYRTEYGDLETACAGNIINHRYVVTAGHCVKGPIEKLIGNLESLRVGDHNTDTLIDCDEVECIEPFERFNVIKRIVHEGFQYLERGRMINDIALVKTDRYIVYSFSVAPICLPDVMSPLKAITTDARLTVAGWGADELGRNFTFEKRIVDVPYVENDKCTVLVEAHQICAGGLSGKDSCRGDSGGALARLSGQNWFLEGIVSYGRKCGTDKPAIYTRVQSYLPWIRQNVDDDSSTSGVEDLTLIRTLASLSIIFVLFL